MTDMQAYYEEIKNLKTYLLDPKDPRAVQSGDSEVDEQIAVCAKNLSVYARLEVKAAAHLSILEKEYSDAYLASMIEYNDERLEAICATRSQKEKLVRAELAEQQRRIDETNSARKYFSRMWETMNEWIQVYKKFRKVE